MALGKCQIYEDLDALEAIERMLQILDATNINSTGSPSSSSNGSRTKKKQRATEKDPAILPQDYLVFARKVAMDYF